MNDRNEILEKCLDQRIAITGVFERFSFITTPHLREIKTALLQDVCAHIDGEDYDIGHVWLQNADSLKAIDLGFGDRIQCNCRVKTFKKRLRVPNRHGLMLENKLSLCFPTEVRIISRLECIDVQEELASIPPKPEVSFKQVDPAAIVVEVQRLANEMGGLEPLQRLIDALRSKS